MARDKSIRLRELAAPGGTLRTDAWWAGPLVTAGALLGFAAYLAWAAFQNGDYHAPPYHSPLYSPCLATNCTAASLALVGGWWDLSPALLVLWVPLGLRATCYYYRKAYSRSLFLAPPACAVPDARRRYGGETGFVGTLQGLHRYFFYLSLPILAFLWWDAARAFRFADGFGVGVGSVVLLVNAVLLTLFAASCSSCRHVCGGHVKSLHQAPLRHRAWRSISRLNENHREYAWASLGSVAAADLYIRLLANGALQDFRLI